LPPPHLLHTVVRHCNHAKKELKTILAKSYALACLAALSIGMETHSCRLVSPVTFIPRLRPPQFLYIIGLNLTNATFASITTRFQPVFGAAIAMAIGLERFLWLKVGIVAAHCQVEGHCCCHSLYTSCTSTAIATASV